jgi:hypothetical protein
MTPYGGPYHITRRHNPEDLDLNLHSRKGLKSYLILNFIRIFDRWCVSKNAVRYNAFKGYGICYENPVVYGLPELQE